MPSALATKGISVGAEKDRLPSGPGPGVTDWMVTSVDLVEVVPSAKARAGVAMAVAMTRLTASAPTRALRFRLLIASMEGLLS